MNEHTEESATPTPVELTYTELMSDRMAVLEEKLIMLRDMIYRLSGPSEEGCVSDCTNTPPGNYAERHLANLQNVLDIATDCEINLRRM